MLIMQIISKATQKCQKPDENNQTTELYWQKLSKEIKSSYETAPIFNTIFS